MSNGVILFAHNSTEIDYGLMSMIAGGLAKKHLDVPVSIITDEGTIGWMKESGTYSQAEKIFDKIIIVERPFTKNVRTLHDGFFNKTVPFINSNRCNVWDLTPYDNTLLIDSDFLIFSDRLNEYWSVDSSIMMSSAMTDITGDRSGILDKRVSETGIHLYWATTVMFKKNQESKFFFQLVDYVKENYRYYADIFRFSPKQYRNDISFSIAKHILNGFETDQLYSLPDILTVFDKDTLIDIENNRLKYLISQPADVGSFWAATTKGVDVHIMNKQSIIRNSQKLLELI